MSSREESKMKRLIIGVALASASLLAMADGPRSQYEQAAVDQAALDPNEAIVNDDGAVEAPNAKMSGTARAYRNGYYNGKKSQKEDDEQANNPPPLPPGYPGQAAPPPRVVAQDDQSHYTTIPAQPRRQPAYAQGYGSGPDEAPYPARPVQQPAPPVNVYVQQVPQTPQQAVQDPNFDPSQWVAQQMQPQPVYVPRPPVYAPRPVPTYTQMPPEAYEPPPGPPASTYVVVPGVPPALATGYWPAYRPVYRRPPVYYYRGW
jgi:hypothetical protein